MKSGSTRLLPRSGPCQDWKRFGMLAPTSPFVFAPKTNGRKDEAQNTNARSREEDWTLQHQSIAGPQIEMAGTSVKLYGWGQYIQSSIPSWVTQSRPQWIMLLPNIVVGLFRFLILTRAVGTGLSALSSCATTCRRYVEGNETRDTETYSARGHTTSSRPGADQY